MLNGIRVVNKRTYRGKGEYVGRPSALGNPFKGERQTVIAQFRDWLWERMQLDSPQLRELRRLRRIWETTGELTLICWCAPLSCHAEVIRGAIEWLAINEKMR
jgi:Domain of unknown function (DUF4326)